MTEKKLKILHLFEAYLPLTENWAYHLISHIPDVEIHIAANHYLKNNFYHPDFYFCDNYYDGLRQYDFSLNRNKAFFKKLMIKVIPYFLGTHQQNVIKYVQKHKIDMIHAHFADVAWRFRQIPKTLNLPFVVSFYGWDYEMLPYTQTAFQQHFKRLFQQADQFICEGSHGAKTLANMGCPSEKIAVVRLGVQAENIPFFQREKSANALKLLQVASFYEKKGHIYTLKAFLKALDSCPNMQLTLVGKDKKNGIVEQLLQLVEESGKADKLQFMDEIDFSKLHSFFSNFDIFIHPSCYAANRDGEGGAPIVILDAQATGMPVIATRHCDIPQEVVHEQTGFLAEEKNVEELTKYIQAFYKMSNADFQFFSKNARHHVLKNFDIKKNAQKLYNVYFSS